MFKFSDVVEIQGQSESVTEKIISEEKKWLEIEITEVKQSLIQLKIP